MSSTASADGGAYFSCPTCLRMYSSTYDEVFRKGAGARPASRVTLAAQQRAPSRRTVTTAPGQQLLPLESQPPPPGDERFARVKARLEAWLRRLDEQDPWYVLGVPPGTSIEKVRARFREQALAHHPDRGGDAATMRRMTRAYDAIRVQLATGRVATGARRHIQAPAAPTGEDEG